MSELAEADQVVAPFVPELEVEGAERSEHGQGGDGREDRVRLVTGLQVVVRDPGVQVVDVVEGDVPRQPLEEPRQLQEGTAAGAGARLP
jgi:hypothetical protein